MSHREFEFNLHKTNFYGQYFKTETVKGVIILVHGMGEHSNRYTNFVIPKLLDKNLSVITYDQFGHGKTEGKRGHNPGYNAILDSLSYIVDMAKEVFGAVPLFLYGHSMGGNVVINYALRKEHNLKGIIATSPLLRLAFKAPRWKLFIGKIIQKIAPSVTMPSELDVNAISRDSTEVKKYIDDPLIHDKISPNYSVTFFETGEWSIKNAHKLQTPMLVIHGTGDQITEYKASTEFVNNTNGMASLELFENGYHELHNDLEKDKFIETLTNWILKTLN